MEEDIKTLFKIFIERYKKVNSMNVGLTMTGENVIYKKMKVTKTK